MGRVVTPGGVIRLATWNIFGINWCFGRHSQVSDWFDRTGCQLVFCRPRRNMHTGGGSEGDVWVCGWTLEAGRTCRELNG
jgi:hypothetical protein